MPFSISIRGLVDFIHPVRIDAMVIVLVNHDNVGCSFSRAIVVNVLASIQKPLPFIIGPLPFRNVFKVREWPTQAVDEPLLHLSINSGAQSKLSTYKCEAQQIIPRGACTQLSTSTNTYASFWLAGQQW
jgi:hypothetical protein